MSLQMNGGVQVDLPLEGVMHNVVSEPKTRQPRSDAGQARLKPRDLDALAWIVDMRAISDVDLGVMLGRLAGSDPIQPKAVAAVVRRWRALGLAESKRIIVGGPVVITPTQRAADMVGAGHRVNEPSWTQITHTMAVAHVRLMIEAQAAAAGVAMQWRSDRAMKAADAAEDAGKKRSSLLRNPHRPDGAVLVEGERTAIEVELTAKAPSRLQAIVDELGSSINYEKVVYFCSGSALDGVNRAVERRTSKKNPIEVRALDVPALTAR